MRITWLDRLVYRFFRWWWEPIFVRHGVGKHFDDGRVCLPTAKLGSEEDWTRWVCVNATVGIMLVDKLVELDQIKAAFAPVNDWYQSDEEHESPLPEKIAWAVEDLQEDRDDLLTLRRLYAERCNQPMGGGLALVDELVKTSRQLSKRERLEGRVMRLINMRAVHKRYGTILGQEEWATVFAHLDDEKRELAEAVAFAAASGVDTRNSPEVLAELGDVLGLVIHAARKAGYTMEQVEERELKKLDERFFIPEEV